MADQKLVVIHEFSFLSLKIFLLDLRNLKLLEKVSLLVGFEYFTSKEWLFGIIYLNFQKDSPKNEVAANFEI